MMSIAEKFGELLKEEMQKNPAFYLFSPDETTSNRLDAVYEASARAWNLPKLRHDLPEAENGRIVEMLSENALFAMMVGHLLNGEPAMMTSYEAFFEIIAAQVLQQIKFLKQAEAVSWRPKYPAINLLSTSVCWRQDHNGFSHQSPALISTLLALPSNKVNCLFPADTVAAERCFKFMMDSRNVVNLTTFDKNPGKKWLNKYHAKFQYENGGVSVFARESDERPDVVLAAAGDIVTRETLAAAEILREDLPEIKLRFVNINALSYGAIGTTENKLTQKKFDMYFTKSKPIVVNFHGYPGTMQGILANYTNLKRVSVHGFVEEGSTTTPFEMLAMNKASRYDVAMDVAKLCERDDLVKKYQKIIKENHKHAEKFGVDKIAL